MNERPEPSIDDKLRALPWRRRMAYIALSLVQVKSMIHRRLKNNEAKPIIDALDRIESLITANPSPLGDPEFRHSREQFRDQYMKRVLHEAQRAALARDVAEERTVTGIYKPAK